MSAKVPFSLKIGATTLKGRARLTQENELEAYIREEEGRRLVDLVRACDVIISATLNLKIERAQPLRFVEKSLEMMPFSDFLDSGIPGREVVEKVKRAQDEQMRHEIIASPSGIMINENGDIAAIVDRRSGQVILIEKRKFESNFHRLSDRELATLINHRILDTGIQWP